MRAILAIILNIAVLCRAWEPYDVENEYGNYSFPFSHRYRRATLCVLPSPPEFGSYTSNVPHASPGQGFSVLLLTVTCGPGYAVMGNPEAFCSKGIWYRAMPYCAPYCKLEKDPSVVYRCLVTGLVEGERACNDLEPPGTMVRPICNAPNYFSSDILPFMRCNEGTWDTVPKCSPECGRVTPGGAKLVAGGREAKKGELPWHAAIYEKTFEPYKQICGGTIVTNTVVISAAHCFFVEVALPPSQFAVAAGKVFRPYDDTSDDESGAQKSDVKDIKMPVRFMGRRGNFQDDIALVYLVKAFVYETYVRPVCLDFNVGFERRQLLPGKLGKVAGWGLTAAFGPSSQVLKVVDLPYVDIGYCITRAPPGFEEYITSDKICAGFENNGTAVCQGDSGGGLAFPERERGVERFYLRGVVSTAPVASATCNVETFTAFTQLMKHEHFIKENIYDGENNKKCGKDQWACKNGACIPLARKCDGFMDCPDRSDESSSICAGGGSLKPSKCIYPDTPENGRLTSSVPANAGEAFQSLQINVTCRPRHELQGSSELICYAGIWSDTVPKCIGQGADCEWNGVEGTCVDSKRCLTTLDMQNEENRPVCAKNGEELTVCCTDCNLIIDKTKAVLSPGEAKILWKNGTKAHNQCLRYLETLPYKCNDGAIRSGLTKDYDPKNQCHNYKIWTKKDSETLDTGRTVTYPYQARFGFINDGGFKIEWTYSGAIVSERYILCGAYAATVHKSDGTLKYAAVGMQTYDVSLGDWSVYEIKRAIAHPDYKENYNNIALVETVLPMVFNKNVLPLCLPSSNIEPTEAMLTTAYDMTTTKGVISNRRMQKLSIDECTNKIIRDEYLVNGYNDTSQMCFKVVGGTQSIGYEGEPLVVYDQTTCVPTIIGVTIYYAKKHVIVAFSRVHHFVPWIESVIWG